MEMMLQAALMGIGIMAIIGVVLFVITRLPELPDGEWRRRLERYMTVRNAAIAAGTLAVVFLIFGLLNGEDFYANLATEMLSVALTVLIIDALYEKGRKADRKQQIIEQMSSNSNDFALEAVRLARRHGWTKDGTLRNIKLEGANLQRAGLFNADLGGANLSFANLQNANLMAANLRGTDLRHSDLRRAHLSGANLEGALLSEANLCDVVFWGANLEGATLGTQIISAIDPTTMTWVEHEIKGAWYNDSTFWPEGFVPPSDAIKIDTTKGNEQLRDAI